MKKYMIIAIANVLCIAQVQGMNQTQQMFNLHNSTNGPIQVSLYQVDKNRKVIGTPNRYAHPFIDSRINAGANIQFDVTEKLGANSSLVMEIQTGLDKGIYDRLTYVWYLSGSGGNSFVLDYKGQKQLVVMGQFPYFYLGKMGSSLSVNVQAGDTMESLRKQLWQE